MTNLDMQSYHTSTHNQGKDEHMSASAAAEPSETKTVSQQIDDEDASQEEDFF